MTRPLAKLMAMADPSAVEGDYFDALETALAAGIRLVQVRAKHVSTREFTQLARRASELCAAYTATLIINDRADLAVSLGADGVHLPAQGLPVDVARRVVGEQLIGVSCHSVNDIIRAEEDGADYVTLSPIFETPSKPGYGPALGLNPLVTAAKLVDIPIFALGGISAERGRECADAGWGIAVMRNVFVGDIDDNVRALLECLQ